MKNNEFYNPYCFIPLEPDAGARKEKQAWKDVSTGNTHIRHDGWPRNLYSGKIKCELNIISPTIVGGKIKEGNDRTPNKVTPYYDPLKPNENWVAIPANSLRGMIGSVIETISQSNLRILDDTYLSARATRGESLSAIGKINKVNGKYFITPLKIKTISYKNDSNPQIDKPWQFAFGTNATWANVLGVYLTEDNRKSILQSNKIESKISLNPTLLDWPISKPLNLNDPTIGNSLEKKKGHNTSFIIGQKPDHKSSQATDGIAYILGYDYNKENNKVQKIKAMPSEKKHEWWVPADSESIANRPQIEVPNPVVKTWEELAQQRTAENPALPYIPFGFRSDAQSSNSQETHTKIELQDGDLVYFDIKETSDNKVVVSEISYSSIWRKKIETTHRYFEDYTPWTAERDSLSPAELMLGVVENNGKRHFASRIRFSDAKCSHKPELEKSRILCELASPKPPSPSLYFKSTSSADGYASKADMAKKTKDIEPNGYKRYLVHTEAQRYKKTWQTKKKNDSSVKRKNNTELIRPSASVDGNNCFSFTVDFENLSAAEYHLLQNALTPKGDTEFCHRLGMGKSLGLGMVQVSIVSTDCIDIDQKYCIDKLSATEHQEKEIAPDLSLIEESSLDTLVLLGKESSLKSDIPVKYPTQQADHAVHEGEHFRWFTNNDASTQKQWLGSASANAPIKPLTENETRNNPNNGSKTSPKHRPRKPN